MGGPSFVPATYELSWPNRATSKVTVSSDARGYAVVNIAGYTDGLMTLKDYRTEAAVEAELRHVAMREGANVVKIQRK